MKKLIFILLICLLPTIALAQEVSLTWDAPVWSGTVTGYRVWMGDAANDLQPLQVMTEELKMPLAIIPGLVVGKWLSVSTVAGNLESAPAVPVQWSDLPLAPVNVKITTTTTVTITSS